ncbi:MAG TPA: LON peptidase substrate-binding domain-containing protein [Dehalococcoidia bacterium]|nr:LON peptidase substrate-binding domain-containing protein [Dehalococcoidia bacterium]
MPLFLLNTTLFPGGILPLHVFEERYRMMIGECLRQNAPFGVVMIRSGPEVGGTAEPHDIGTTARITHVQRLPDGRMNLLTVGVSRFRIMEVLRQVPFYLADVELLESTDNDIAIELAETVGNLFAEYYRLYLALSGQWARRVATPQDPAALSDFIASRLEIRPEQKQELLEKLSTRERLLIEVGFLEGAIRALKTQVAALRNQKWHSAAALN